MKSVVVELVWDVEENCEGGVGVEHAVCEKFSVDGSPLKVHMPFHNESTSEQKKNDKKI